MLTFAGKYEVRFMRKSVFYKRVLHTRESIAYKRWGYTSIL